MPTFVYKSAEEVEAMSANDFEKYTTEKNAFEAEQRKAEIDKAIEEANKNNASKEDVEKLVAKQAEIIKEMERMTLRMKRVGDVTSEGSDNTLRGALTKAFEGVKDEIEKAIAGNQDATIKAAVTMQVDNTIGAGATQVTITQNTGLISPIRKRELTYLANVSVGRTAGNRVVWIEELDEQGTPIMLGEGDAKTQLSVRYEEKTASVKKIAVYGKVTTEMMADLPQLISYIENNLMRRLDIVLENQLFNGNNTGDNLNGATNLATPFTGGGLAGTLPTGTANDYDVVRAIALQCEEAFGMPNAVFVHPAIVARMNLEKDSTGQYLMPAFATASGLQVAGMRVIPTTAMTGENFIGGDLTVLNVLIREELGIQIGLDGNDFTNNKKTMLVEKRMVQYASANDVQCLIKGDFAAAKTTLEV